jgi:hypothetical protein
MGELKTRMTSQPAAAKRRRPNERRGHMSLMTAEGGPATAVEPGVVSTRPASTSGPLTGKPEHSGRSAYTCPACRQVEDAKGCVSGEPLDHHRSAGRRVVPSNPATP